MRNGANFSRNRTRGFIVGRSLWSRERIGWQAKAPAPQERKPPRAKGMLGKVCGISDHERFRSPKSAGLKPAAARIGCPTNGAAQHQVMHALRSEEHTSE